MIDIEQDVYNLVKTAVNAVAKNAFIVGKETRSPSQFPFVSVVEANNSAVVSTQDSGSTENHALLMYEVNVISNKQNGGKSECKAILSSIDNAFIESGFTRKMKRPVSMDDATKYRLIARYECVADAKGTIYRR